VPSGRATYAALAICAALAAPATASAAATDKSSAGGVVFVETPRIGKVVCVKRCAAGKRVQGGSLVRLSGRSLGDVSAAVFHGSDGDADDVRTTRVRSLGTRRARARVPKKAVSGPISLVTAAEVSSPPSQPLAILPPLPGDVLAGADHVFPVRGKFRFGGSAGRFGAGRGGRSHHGHDVFARCGTPMVAARGGSVQMEGYHGLAGYYLVIDGEDTATDYVYMHLAERSPFRRGDSVATGQRIGSVGDTGNASGCHLHFELWSGPGYYEGGRPFDPFPALRSWARADAARRAARS